VILLRHRCRSFLLGEGWKLNCADCFDRYNPQRRSSDRRHLCEREDHFKGAHSTQNCSLLTIPVPGCYLVFLLPASEDVDGKPCRLDPKAS